MTSDDLILAQAVHLAADAFNQAVKAAREAGLNVAFERTNINGISGIVLGGVVITRETVLGRPEGVPPPPLPPPTMIRERDLPRSSFWDRVRGR